MCVSVAKMFLNKIQTNLTNFYPALAPSFHFQIFRWFCGFWKCLFFCCNIQHFSFLLPFEMRKVSFWLQLRVGVFEQNAGNAAQTERKSLKKLILKFTIIEINGL